MRRQLCCLTGFAVLSVAGLLMNGTWGCGGSSTRGASSSSSQTLSATVSLPSGSSGSLSALGFKSATTEVAQAGMTVECYDDDDTLLGTCETGADGACSVADLGLEEGDHTLFVRTLDASGDEVAGAIVDVTVAADTTTITGTVNSEEDLAYRSWLASCEEQLGAPCVPGTNLAAGIALVVPRCVRDAIADMAGGSVDDTTAGGNMAALLEAHRTNLGEAVAGGVAPPVDMACVMMGDASCSDGLVNTAGTEIAAAVSTSTAASTAASMLDSIVNSLCSDPTTFATIAADANYLADPGSVFNLFGVVAPGEVGSITAATMKGMITNSQGVGGGFALFADPFAAKAMMGTFFQGGFDNLTTGDDYAKRAAVLMGAFATDAPTDFDDAASWSTAAMNIFNGDNFAEAGTANCLDQFGPMLANGDQRTNFISGGSQAFDNMIDQFGSLEEFGTQFGNLGADAFLTSYTQQEIGGTCSNTYDCVPPLTCSSSLCGLNGSTTLTGGPGTACTSNTQCAASSGFACVGGFCAYSNYQVAGTDFGSGFTAPTDGTQGGPCLSGNTCNSGLICDATVGICVSTAGATDGSLAAGATCTGHVQCGSGYCGGTSSARTCRAMASGASGDVCSATSQCVSGTSCTSGVCTATATPLVAAGGSCTATSQCASGLTCTSGTCQASFTPVTRNYTTAGGSSTCAASTYPLVVNQTSATAGTVTIANGAGGGTATISGSTISLVLSNGAQNCASGPYSATAIGPLNCSGMQTCVIHATP